MVLGMHSPYLKFLLTNHHESEPTLIFVGITFADLQAMLEYMYLGKLGLTKDQGDSFYQSCAFLGFDPR